jgi:hypothetical protein
MNPLPSLLLSPFDPSAFDALRRQLDRRGPSPSGPAPLCARPSCAGPDAEPFAGLGMSDLARSMVRGFGVENITIPDIGGELKMSLFIAKHFGRWTRVWRKCGSVPRIDSGREFCPIPTPPPPPCT